MTTRTTSGNTEAPKGGKYCTWHCPAVFFMAAASTGLIPGVAPLGHGYD
jgi:hypothetical protein